MKYITRTIKATIVNVYGINPEKQTVETKPYLFDGDFDEANLKDVGKIKSELIASDFMPAYVKPSGKTIEKKYAISLEDFLKYAHVISDDEKVEEA